MDDGFSPDRGTELGARLARILLLLDSSAADVADKIAQLQAGNDAAAEAAARKLTELRKWAQLAYEERNRIDRLIRDYADGNPEHAIDFAEARAEIGRRLDRLRAAAGAGEVPG
ncbi:MAG: permease [Rhodobacteraceae bacterium]|nr:permease [Paracoccaceae bacterium]